MGFINNRIKKKIENNAKKTVDTFYHTEVEEMFEFAAVTFLYNYRDHVR